MSGPGSSPVRDFARTSSPRRASTARIRVPAFASSDSRFFLINVTAGACFSMNTTFRAPRLNASMPTAPVPANRSTKKAPATRSPRMLKRVSRKRSLVGRSAMPLGLFKCRLRYFPAITRINARTSPDVCQMIPPLPLGWENPQYFPQRIFFVGQREGFFASEFQQLPVAQRIRHVKSQLARLFRTEKFSGPAQLQIRFGNFETVVGAHQGLQPLESILAQSPLGHQNAIRFLCAATDTSAQLVQLRQPKSFRVFN